MTVRPSNGAVSRRALLAGGAAAFVSSGCARVPLAASRTGLAQALPSTRAAFDALPQNAGITTVTLLPDNPAAWAARWRRIAATAKTIDASYFIVEDDVFGVAFLGHLYARAKAGVAVRLVIDARGSIPMTGGISGRDYLQELARIGVDVHVFNPPLPAALRAVTQGNIIPMSAGTHNKTLVFDGRSAITGGRNISAQYFVPYTQRDDAFADLDVVLDGVGAADALSKTFAAELASSWGGEVLPEVVDVVPRDEELLLVAAGMDAWLNGTVSLLPADLAVLELEDAAVRRITTAPRPEARLRARRRFEELAQYTSLWGTLKTVETPDVTAEVRIVSRRSRTRDNDDTMNAALTRCLAAARKRVLIESPYFVLTPRLLTAFREASARGVSIEVITNSARSSDNDVAQSLFIDAAPELLALIPTLRLFVPRNGQTLHLKRILIDDELSLVGTYNIDPFSAHMNSETMVGVWSAPFHAQCAADATARIAQGFEYVAQRDSRGRVHRYPPGHPFAGQVVMVFGPRDHVAPERIAELEAVRALIISIRGIWDFDVVTFERDPR